MHRQQRKENREKLHILEQTPRDKGFPRDIVFILWKLIVMWSMPKVSRTFNRPVANGIRPYDRLLSSYCRLYVYVRMSFQCDAVHCDAQSRCRRLKAAPACSHDGTSSIFRYFCCRMYRSATKHKNNPSNRRNFPIWNNVDNLISESKLK